MIIFKNELPMNHEKSIQHIVNQWIQEFYQDIPAVAEVSIEQHLKAEGLEMEIRNGD